MSKELIRLSNCSMAFDGEYVLNNINLYFNDKKFLTLLGPSGCGKTTMLRIIGGFLKPTSGDVYFDGVRINDVPPHKRMVNTIFQKYALFTHLNVFENIAFGLRLQRHDGKKLGKDEISSRVMEMLEVVSLKGFEKRDVTLLSGGQQQRVAIARALVNEPTILFADEPTANLDTHSAATVMETLARLNGALGVTVVFVSHDAEDRRYAMEVVDMHDGQITASSS